eukprot:TRINITY_DN20044_c0_g2_i1.p1 TRINITY_DN20044_c0_g2~~TRINITY_DN20044_c0_g2_i1.p1  ORF type:complete len:787 (+),score=189.48 TRINITY_DN20044_c0_g2_i1:118-2478(+)
MAAATSPCSRDDSQRWQEIDNCAVHLEDVAPKYLPAATEEDICARKAECISMGYGGFVVRRDKASLRPVSRQRLLRDKVGTGFYESARLYVAPAAVEVDEADDSAVTLRYGAVSRRACRELLQERSGYFASRFRHNWADSGGMAGYVVSSSSSSCPSGGSCGSSADAAAASFADFPGGERAFEIAAAWLARSGQSDVLGEPWPVVQTEDAELAIHAAAYLDAPGLLRSAVLSWLHRQDRQPPELLGVAGAMVTASLQFESAVQDLIIEDLRSMLREIPRHRLALTSDFLVSPAAGLAVLDVRDTAKESLVGHIKNVGGFLGAVIKQHTSERKGSDPPAGTSAQEAELQALCSTPHEFSVRLLVEHQGFFAENLPMLRRLFRHIDETQPIATPLCFHVAASAALAEQMTEDEVFAGYKLAVDIFQRGLSASADPVTAAAEEACASTLFGAGETKAVLDLDVLCDTLVPPAAAAMVLNRVLSEWAKADSRATAASNGSTATAMGRKGQADSALETITAAIEGDRQGLRRLLLQLLPHIRQADGVELLEGCTWGTIFDLAVPMLRAAFMHVAERALAEEHAIDDTMKLLFQIVYRPSEGLPGESFPLELLLELKEHSAPTQVLARNRVLQELEALLKEPYVLRSSGNLHGHAACLRKLWKTAMRLWAAGDWERAGPGAMQRAVCFVKKLLKESEECKDPEVAQEGSEATVEMLGRLPLEQLLDHNSSTTGLSVSRSALQLLGPPIPAHVLGSLALQAASANVERLRKLEDENMVLKEELLMFKAHGSSR